MIRAAQPTDQAYVASTWTKNLPDGTIADRNALVDRLLDDRRTLVLVEEHQDRIVGWIAYCAKPRVLLYVYVRAARRREGMARALLAATGLSGAVACLFDSRHLSALLPNRIVTTPEEYCL